MNHDTCRLGGPGCGLRRNGGFLHLRLRAVMRCEKESDALVETQGLDTNLSLAYILLC